MTQIHEATDGILAVMESLKSAHAKRDADGIVALYEDGAVVYDMAPPLGRRGIDKSLVERWLDTWDGGIALEFRNPEIVCGGDVAFVSSLSRMQGSTSGKIQDLWFRTTLCLRNGPRGWRIAHDHTSVPFSMDGSDKAALDLKPD